jgi:hypothetical protein
MTKEKQIINPPRCVPFGHWIDVERLSKTEISKEIIETTEIKEPKLLYNPFYLPIEENSGLNIIVRGENPSPFILKAILSLYTLSSNSKINIKRNCVASMTDLINNPKDTHNIFFISEGISDEIRNSLKSLIVIDTKHKLEIEYDKTIEGDIALLHIYNMSFMPCDAFIVSLNDIKD